MAEALRDEIKRLRAENLELRGRLEALERPDPGRDRPEGQWKRGGGAGNPAVSHSEEYCPAHNLTPQQVGRYSRQLLMRSFGVEGAAPC